ncbi:MAG: helix-turn-helix domain-containing protein, partial [Wujia sp.]
MILADKIMNLRKQHGMSQEDLANELGISRQSVSKWESGASIPDLDKIIKLSNLFGVSTDFLIKDEMENIAYMEPSEDSGISEDEDNAVSISVEIANEFMETTRRVAGKIGIGVVLCILSPICLIFLGGLSEYGGMKQSEDLLSGIGVSILLIIVAIAVGFFIIYGMQLEKFSYIDKERISLGYGVKGIVEKKKESYEMKFRRDMVIGVVLCIIGVIPLIITGSMEMGNFISVICVDILLIL